jgi:hypothetical protein
MSRSASQQSKRLSSIVVVGSDKEGTLPRVPRRLRKGNRPAPRGRSSPGVSVRETPFGALHVDASGVVLEHRPAEAGEPLAPARLIVGRPLRSVAPWASEPAFLAALQSAINSSTVSFHFDFKISATSIERVIHVNILAVGDKTAWIFVSDTALAMISS